MDTPVLLLAFNRPDLTARVFDRIREAKPYRLFYAVDGARRELEGESSVCNETRRIIEKVDWNCEVRTLFREENLGCRVGVRSAVTWFFEHVEEGIILEDDCLPDLSFFPFCEQLLERYRDDKRVMCITGNNFQQGQLRGNASYYFSIYTHIWGWASWRRAWDLYDAEMSALPEAKTSGLLNGFLRDEATAYWENMFTLTREGKIDTWDYAWLFSCWANHGLTATPQKNLVSNIGFDERATHTTNRGSEFASLASAGIAFPLQSPKRVVREVNADRFVEENNFGIDAQPKEHLAYRAIDCHTRKQTAVEANIRKYIRKLANKTKSFFRHVCF